MNNALSIYSQGNFCFDEVHSTDNPLHILQNDVKKESFIAEVGIEHARLVNRTTSGLMNLENMLSLIDNSAKIADLSNKIKNCNEIAYRLESAEMIKAQKAKNLGKKDLRWLISKLNYYSIGAKLLSYLHSYLYKKAY